MYLRVLVLAAVVAAGCGSPAGPQEMQQSGAGAPSSIDRGRYLATAVALCAFCHSEVDWNADGFPPKAGTVGAGRAPFGPALPWLTSPNLTPDRETGAGSWTDAMLEDALRRGIGHDGRTLHPLMPYHEFHGMTDDDAASIIKFLRSLAPVRNPLPATQIPEEMKASLTPLPPTGVVKGPERSATAQYGEYLARLALCGQCHTPKDAKGQPIPGMEFAGGVRLRGPWGDVTSLNLTQDNSGIQGINEKLFAAMMRTGHVPGGGRLNAIMPWGYYQNLTDEDVRSIYLYLKTLKPVEHYVDNDNATTPCRKCGGLHGDGAKNDSK
jgi:mono/diheme cytochrome c family protein